MGGDLAPSFWGRKKISRTNFSEKISILTPNISDDLLFSHRSYFVSLSLLSEIQYNRFDKKSLFKKNSPFFLFFSQFVLCHASSNTISRNSVTGGMDGGMDVWAVPSTSNFG